MLKEAFEKDFYCTHPKKEGVLVNINERVCSSDFSLYDPKPCNGWSGRAACSKNTQCDHINIQISADGNVYVVSMDEVLSYLKDSLPFNADYVMCDDTTFRVVEMTCMEETYVSKGGKTYPTGKRAHAQSQCEKLLTLMYECGPLGIFINRRKVKEAIFAWRDPNTPIIEDDAAASFVLMQQAIDEANMSKSMSFNFQFREIQYPNVLTW